MQTLLILKLYVCYRVLSKRALVTFAIIFCVSFTRTFYITLLSNVDGEAGVMEGVQNRRDSEAGRCHFDLPESQFTLRGTRLQRDLMRGATACRDVRRPLADSVRTNGRWHIQDTGNDKLVLYSAFYDDRPAVGVTPWLRIIGVAKLENRTHYCHVWYQGCEAPYVTTVVVNVTGRDFGYGINNVRYVQYLFSCRLPGVEPVPSHVSVVADHCAQSTVYLPVERPVRAEPDIEFGVCVAIAFGSIPTPMFVEWIELTWMLGVREFNVYDAGMVNMSAVFDYYTRRGWLKVHQMPPPVHDFGNKRFRNGTNSTLQVKNCEFNLIHKCMTLC